MAGILNIRPVLAIVDGEVEVIAKPRSHRRAMSKLVSEVVDAHAPLTNLAVMHTDSTSQGEAEELLAELKGGVQEGGMAITANVGPAIGSHLGTGTVALGVSW